MEIILEVLTKALDTNISYAVLMDIVIGFLYLFNIILGTIIGTRESHFDIKKFLSGILKAILVLMIVVGVCYILNVFALTISLINGIEISEEFVSTIQILGILITQGIDIANELKDKISSIRDLKYVSTETVTISDTNLVEPIEFKG